MYRKLLLVALLLGAAPAFAQQQPASNEPKQLGTTDYKLVGAPLPPVNIVTVSFNKDSVIEGKSLTNTDLEGNGNLFVMLFSPTCSHCEEAGREFEQLGDKFIDSKLVLVAAKSMKKFFKEYFDQTHIDKYPNIMVGYDNLDLVIKTFQYQSLPQINVYDKNRKLLKIFAGSTAVDSAKRYIN